MTDKSVYVYCSSRSGAIPAYKEEAEKLGKAIALEGWRLVYGAGDVGLMGATTRTVQAADGDTFGAVPTHLVAWEAGKPI